MPTLEETLDAAKTLRVSAPDRAALLQQVQETPSLSSSQKETLSAALQQRDDPAPALAGRPRQEMQDWEYFPVYLSSAVWKLLTDQHAPELQKLKTLARHLAKLGLRCPTEGTIAVVCSVLQLGGMESWDGHKSLQYLNTVKGILRSELALWKNTASNVLTELPLQHPPQVLQVMGSDPPVAVDCMPVKLDRLLMVARSMPRRKTHRQAKLPSGTSSLAGPPAGQDAFHAFTVLLHQFASVAAQGRDAASQIQLLEAGRKAVAQTKDPAARRVQKMLADLPAEPDTVKAREAPPVPASTGPRLALEDDCAEPSYAASSNPQKAEASAGAQSAPPASAPPPAAAASPPAPADKAPQAVDPAANLGMQARSEKVGPRVPLQESLLRLRAALHGAPEQKPAESAEKAPHTRKRPAAATDLQTTGSGMKRPSAKAKAKAISPDMAEGSAPKRTAVKRDPASSLSPAKVSALKRPAAKKTAKSKAKAKLVQLTLPSMATRVRQFPSGCSRCRYTRACTFSCWQRRLRRNA